MGLGRFGAITVAALVAALAACSGNRSTESTAPVPTAVPATEQPATVVGEAQTDAEATIQSIDAKTRSVTLRTADGRTEVVQVQPDVDLAKLKKGDVVMLSAYQRLSVKALPPGAAPLGVVREAAMARSQPGQQPGRAIAEVTRVISEIAAIDLVNNTVTLRGADGALQTLSVKNPENQQKLKTLKPGDLVQIDLLEVVAVGLKPKA
jgi:Cu/Ag efflux protein CusF